MRPLSRQSEQQRQHGSISCEEKIRSGSLIYYLVRVISPSYVAYLRVLGQGEWLRFFSFLMENLRPD